MQACTPHSATGLTGTKDAASAAKKACRIDGEGNTAALAALGSKGSKQMGSSTMKHMRKALATLLAVVLAFTMTPAAALANTESTVRVTAVGKFTAVEKSIPPTSMTVATSKNGNVNDPKSAGVLWAQFEYGKPKSDAQGAYYDAVWEWTKTTKNAQNQTVSTQGTYPTSGFERVSVYGNAAAQAAPRATLVLDTFFKGTPDRDRVGTYAFTLRMTDAGGNVADATYKFSITEDSAKVNQLTNNGVTIKGAFTATADLVAANLKTSDSASAQTAYTKLLQATSGSVLDSAYQLDIVNGGLFYDPQTSLSQDSVVVPASDALLAAAQAGQQITIVGLANGSLQTRVYERGQSGTYVNKSDVSDALKIDTTAKTLEFNTVFPGENIGAFAVAYANPTVAKYTVSIQTAGVGTGSVSPSTQIEYVQGDQPTYTFYAGEGCSIDSVSVATTSGAAYTKYTQPTSDSLKLDGIDANLVITVTFGRVAQSTSTARTLAVQQVGAGPNASISAVYTRLSGSVTGEATSTNFPLTDVADGTSPKLTISAGEGYTVKAAWLYPTQGGQANDSTKVSIVGGAYMLPGMDRDMTLRVEYSANSYEAPAETHTVYGIVEGNATSGEFSGWTLGDDGRYSVQVVEPNFQTVKVRAATSRNWAVDTVKLYDGINVQGQPKQVLYKAGANDALGEFSYTIPAVTGDCTVVAAFKQVTGTTPEPPVVTPDPVEKTYTVVASANGRGSISPAGTQQVRAGSDQTFTVIPQNGYEVKRVTANGREVGTTLHEQGYSTFTAYDIQSNLTIVATFQKISAGSEQPPIVQKPLNVKVSSVGFGRAYPTGTSKVAAGEDLTITLEPNEGCSLSRLELTKDGVTTNVKSQVNKNVYVLKNVQQDAQVVATFVNTKGETTEGGGSGSGSGSGSGDVDIDIDIDVDIDVSTEKAPAAHTFAARAAGDDEEIGGAVSPMHVTIKKGQAQKFIIKPFNGSYVKSVTAVVGDSTQQCEVGNIPLVGNAEESDEGVNKPYSYAIVKGIDGNVSLRIVFDSCMNDPANTAGEYYIYDQAAGTIVNTAPTTKGDVDIEFPGNDPDVPVGDTGEVVVKPSDPNKPIDHIEMLDHTLDFEFDDDGNINKVIIDKGKPGEKVIPIDPAGDLDKIKDAIEEFNKVIDKELGYDRDDGSGGRPDYVVPGTTGDGDDKKPDGSYDINVPTTDKKGEPVDPDLNVGTTDADEGVLYQYKVNINVSTDDSGNGGTVTVLRNGKEWTGSLREIPMNHTGSLVLQATPNEGYGVRFVVADDSKSNITDSSENTVAQVLANAFAQTVGTPTSKSYTVTGSGKVNAQFYRLSTTDPDDPNNPGGGDDPNNPGGDDPNKPGSGDDPNNPGGGDGDGDNPNNPGGGDNPNNPNSPNGNLGSNDVAAGTAFVVEATAQGRGLISPSGTLYYSAGAVPEFNLIADSGYQVSAVVVNGVRQAWTSSKYSLAGCSGGKTYKIVAEFSPTSPAAATVSTGSKLVRSVTGLAQTGDLAAPGVLTLAAIACAGLGVAILTNGRRRKDEHAQSEE